jgi:hypothetical protein
MKVLKDNNCKNIEKDIKKYPRKLICDDCLSELEYEEEDMRIGALGCMFVDCPCCGSSNFIDDEDGITLTKDNVEFPTHFFHTSKETCAVDCCNNDEIKKYIYKAIDYFRKNKNEYHWFTATGNLRIDVSRYDGDECYEVIVTNNYYETLIPFEREDY